MATGFSRPPLERSTRSARTLNQFVVVLHIVDLAIAVRVNLELGVARPVPGVLNQPTLSDVLQVRLSDGADGFVAVRYLFDRLADAADLAADCEHRGTDGPVLRHPLLSRHSPKRLSKVKSVLALVLAGL
jgi:hypothetical protein